MTECHGYRVEYECLLRKRLMSGKYDLIDKRLRDIRQVVDSTYPNCFAAYWP
jgi:hypothetical protein